MVAREDTGDHCGTQPSGAGDEGGAERGSPRQWQSLDGALFAVLFVVFLLVAPGQVRSDALGPFWAWRDVFPPAGLWPTGFPEWADRPGMTLGMLPLYLFGHAAALLLGAGRHHAEQVVEFLVSLTNPLLTAATAALLAGMLRQLGLAPRSSCYLGLLYGLGSVATLYARTVMGDPAIGLWLLLAARELLRERPRSWLAGLLLLAAGAWKPSAVPFVAGLGVVALALCIRGPSLRRAAIAAGALLAPSVAGVGVWVGVNYLRSGGWMSQGYGDLFADTQPFPSRSVPGGLYEVLLGANGGLVPYTPLLLLLPLWIRRAWDTHRRLLWVALVPAGVGVAFYSRYFSYADSYSYGPRLLLPVLPGLLLLGAAGGVFSGRQGRWEGRTSGGLAVLSLCLGIGCLLGGPSRLVSSCRTHGELKERRQYDIREAQVWQVWPGTVARWERLFRHTDTLRTAARKAAGQPGTGLGDVVREGTPDYWWLTLWLVGMPPAFAFTPPALLAGLLVLYARRLRRLLSQDPARAASPG